MILRNILKGHSLFMYDLCLLAKFSIHHQSGRKLDYDNGLWPSYSEQWWSIHAYRRCRCTNDCRVRHTWRYTSGFLPLLWVIFQDNEARCKCTSFELVKHMPLWLPGAGWKRHAIKTEVAVHRLFDEPYDTVKTQRVSWLLTITFELFIWPAL